MAQILTSGGGVIFTPDGKKLTRQVYILTEGETSVSPASVEDATITSADFVETEAGTTRVTVTWTQGLDGLGSGGSAGGGSTVEIIGGAREVPLESHNSFKIVSDDQLKEIKAAIQAGRDLDVLKVPADAERARQLYKLLLRGQEYYLAPAVSYRQTTLESELPTLNELCTVNSPQRAPKVGASQNWLLSSINARSVAQPAGGVRYEVTKEWMLSDRNGWDPEKLIYNGT
jgi:hypothetical protein